MNEALMLAAALVITGPRTDLPEAQVQARFESECVDGKWNAATCPALRGELEMQLYNDLRALEPNGDIDRAALMSAARARFPMLAELGLRKLGKINTPQEREAVLAAVDHPSPAVRALAKQMLEVQDDRWRKGLGTWWRPGTRNGFAGLVPDTAPEAAQIGLANLKDPDALRYRYFASAERERRVVFTTRLTPDQVMTLIGKGAKVFDGTKLPAGARQQATMAQQMQGVQQEIQAAMARGDMKKVAEISQRINTQMQAMIPEPEAATLRPVAEFSAAPASIRYVQLPAGKKNGAPITAAASREEAFSGETVVVIQY